MKISCSVLFQTGADSSKIFKRLIKGFRRLVSFSHYGTEQMHQRKNYRTHEEKSKNEVESEDGLAP
jgi:hypothetical protein